MRKSQFLVCAAAAPLLISAAEPVRLPPASKWVLEYADESCRLSRAFGDSADRTLLVFESDAPGRLSMLAVGKPLKSSPNASEASAVFLPGERSKSVGRPSVTAAARTPAVLWHDVYFSDAVDEDNPASEAFKAAREAARRGERPPPVDAAKRAANRASRNAFAASVTAIPIEARRNRPVVLETGSMGEAIKMLDQCSRDQLRGWGIDPEIDEKIVRRVWAPDASRWFSANSYPMAGLMNGHESVVGARLLVDAAGKVTKCTSLSPIKAPEFEKAVCETFLRRAQFHPAELADGTRVPSYYVVTTRFQLR